MNTILQTRSVPIRETADVAVAGGGIAGVAAALAAARQGAKTVLIEREYALGGLATLGLITCYLPICDGMGHQVSFGIAEELLRESIRYGYEGELPLHWLNDASVEERASGERFIANYNPALCAAAWEKLLIKEGVRILYGTLLSGCVTDEGRIRQIILEGKKGAYAIEAKAYVDASGDADLAYQAGEATRLFRQGNILASWYYSNGKDGYRLNTLGFCDVPDEYKDGNGPELLADRRFEGLDADELSRMMMLSRDVMLEHCTSHDCVPVTTASIPQVRMTRCLQGRLVMDDKQPHTFCATSVGLFSDWRKRGPVYELPFETLAGVKNENLFMAGRCISVTDSMWDITRVIPVCAVSGAAAGTAAALCANGALSVEALQAALTKSGVRLHE